MILAHFLAICGPKLAHFQDPFGLERGQNCSPWALNGPIPLVCAPQIVQEYLWGKNYDPLLIDFWSQNDPFSRHFVTLEGPKWLAMGSKWAHFNCLGTPNGLVSFLEKPIFDPFLTIFCPKTAHFQGILGF